MFDQHHPAMLELVTRQQARRVRAGAERPAELDTAVAEPKASGAFGGVLTALRGTVRAARRPSRRRTGNPFGGCLPVTQAHDRAVCCA